MNPLSRRQNGDGLALTRLPTDNELTLPVLSMHGAALVQATPVGHQRRARRTFVVASRQWGLPMDEVRKIRFLVPAILFLASLLVGALLDHQSRKFVVDVIKSSDWSKSLGLIAGGGALVLAAGYVIGTFSWVSLRLIFCLRPSRWGTSRFHEVAFSDESFVQVWEKVTAPLDNSAISPDRLQELSAGAAFDYGVLRERRPGIHEWLLRRWNGFNTAANSLWALPLSFPVGCCIIGLPWNWVWFWYVVVFADVLVFVIYWSWNDTMKMASFMASLENTPRLRDIGEVGSKSGPEQGPPGAAPDAE
jgi:hypothetical protein